MGRPIQKKSFGDVAAPGLQFAITAKLPGVAVGEGYIVEQTGTSKYKVNIDGNIGDVFLVNTVTPANLSDGQAFIAVTPFGGSTVAASKIMQRRVNVWLTPDTALSTSRSYVWSGDPADAIGKADVGVSTAGATSNLLGTDEIFVMAQEEPTPGTPFIDTWRALGWSDQNNPSSNQHRTFATSDNKIVCIFESDASVTGGAVLVMDGTTDPVPTVIGGAAITGSTAQTLGNTDEFYETVLQLTDTRYVRISTNPQTVEIVDVNLTTGAGAVVATYDLNAQFAVANQGTTDRDRRLIKLSSTQFAVAWVDEGITNTATTKGSIQMVVLQDNTNSIGTVMGKTTVLDITAPADNDGDAAASCNDITFAHLDVTNRRAMLGINRSANLNFDYLIFGIEFAAGFTSIATTGARTLVLDDATFNGSYQPRLLRVSDTHALLNDEHRGPTLSRNPHFSMLVEMNPSTLAITNGAAEVLGPNNGSGEAERDYGVVIIGNNAYEWTGWNDDDSDQLGGTATVNQTAFDNTSESRDRFVSTASALTTDWAGSFTNTTVCAVDTGFTYIYDGANWNLMTTNLNTLSPRRGNMVFSMSLDTGTNTVTDNGYEIIYANDGVPRWESDGGGGVQPTFLNNASSLDSGNIVELPNGRIVLTGEAQMDWIGDEPYLTKAAYDGRGTLDYGGDFMCQYWDPTLATLVT
jgi:hypothetical protein